MKKGQEGSKKRVLLLLLGYAILVNVLTMHPPFSILPNPATTAYDSAEVLKFEGSNPYLLPETGWRSIALPDDWYLSEKNTNQYWYRVYFPASTSLEKIWQVYIPSVTHNAEVYINGVWVGRGGTFSSPVSRHHNEPLSFEFDSSIVNSNVNVAEFRIKASHPRQGYLGPVFIAPSSNIEPVAKWKYFVRIDFVHWMTVSMLLLSFVVFLFWLARRKDHVYLIFSLQLLLWSAHNLNLFVSRIPTSALFWEAMTMVMLGWAVVLMLVFNHRFLQGGSRTVERIAIAFAILGSGIFLLPDIELVLSWGYRLWDSLLVLIGIYCIGFLVYQYCHKDSRDALLMMVAGIPILAFGFHDILLVNYFIDRSEGLIIQYSAIPAVVLFTWFLVRRFVQSLNLAESLTATLEQRVRDREHQLRQQFQQVQILENDKVLADERNRIMRDMHDGMGGQLVALASSLHDAHDPALCEVRSKVQECITDLRLVIDSLDPMLNDLPTLLGTMRMRLEYLLDSASIQLEWRVEEIESELGTSPQRNLHLMRFVQEAITNVIKHSQSDRLQVEAGVDADMQVVYLRIRDFGRGFCQQSDNISRGIRNMRYRAEQLSATLNLHTNSAGTCVELLWPSTLSSEQACTPCIHV